MENLEEHQPTNISTIHSSESNSNTAENHQHISNHHDTSDHSDIPTHDTISDATNPLSANSDLPTHSQFDNTDEVAVETALNSHNCKNSDPDEHDAKDDLDAELKNGTNEATDINLNLDTDDDMAVDDVTNVGCSNVDDNSKKSDNTRSHDSIANISKDDNGDVENADH